MGGEFDWWGRRSESCHDLPASSSGSKVQLSNSLLFGVIKVVYNCTCRKKSSSFAALLHEKVLDTVASQLGEQGLLNHNIKGKKEEKKCHFAENCCFTETPL